MKVLVQFILVGTTAVAICGACSNNTRVKRGVRDHAWPGGIVPYAFKPDFPMKDRNKFLEATRYIEQRTCIRFKPKGHQDKFYLNLVLGGCCSAHVGRQRHLEGKGQPVTMSSGLSLPFYLHELGHALGFPHEQDRPDRDEFIYWDKNKGKTCDGFASKMDNLDEAIRDIPFDYVSLMADWTECYWPRPPTPKNIPMGPGSSEARTFSVIDIERLNSQHECRGCHGYRFVKISKLPRNQATFNGGYELDRRPFQICRVYHEGHLLVGKFLRNENKCFVAFAGGEEVYREKFSVLTNPGNVAYLKWVRSNSRNNPKAIKGGRTRDRETIYIGRCMQKHGNKDTVIPGFYLESNPSELRIPYGGGVRICKNFEVLVCN